MNYKKCVHCQLIDGECTKEQHDIYYTAMIHAYQGIFNLMNNKDIKTFRNLKAFMESDYLFFKEEVKNKKKEVK